MRHKKGVQSEKNNRLRVKNTDTICDRVMVFILGPTAMIPHPVENAHEHKIRTDQQLKDAEKKKKKKKKLNNLDVRQ